MRTPQIPRLTVATLPLLVALAVAGCGGSDDGDAGGGRDDDPGRASVAGQPQPAGETPATCDLLTDDEITGVLGAHRAGEQDYAYGGCFWASAEQDAAGVALGLYATVLTEEEFAGLDPEPGEPIGTGPDGATWFERDGQLWFPCGDGLRCGVIAAFDPVDARLPAALEVAALLEERVPRS